MGQFNNVGEFAKRLNTLNVNINPTSSMCIVAEIEQKLLDLYLAEVNRAEKAEAELKDIQKEV